MQTSSRRPKKDFTKAQATVIVSDLHLCDSEPFNPRRPLWKKFKTRQFFFDDAFSEFIDHVLQKSEGLPVELVLNGDIFDFDSFMSLPEKPPYRISWLERHRGLRPEEARSVFKIKRILDEHQVWLKSLQRFLKHHAENRIIFVIGNHDLELHFSAVQESIRQALDIPPEQQEQIRFNAWFYISNEDTLIEHGNQYDPYCLCQNPVNPLIRRFNHIELRLPFGNLAGRYMTNGMGFFNPQVDTNYIMPLKEYLRFFFKYMIWTQPLILWTWFWGAVVTLWQAFFDRLRPALKDPLVIEDQYETIAANANATPRIAREMRELMAHPATSHPLLLARELWLDRAFFVLVGFLVFFQIFTAINLMYSLSFYWMFIPMSLFVPFFIFYAQSISSNVLKYKEPDERVLTLSSQITKTKRVIYGHTHIARHEWIGSVEHLNSGTWSPAFLDVECTKPMGRKTYIWISPTAKGTRRARLLEFHPSPSGGRQGIEENSQNGGPKTQDESENELKGA